METKISRRAFEVILVIAIVAVSAWAMQSLKSASQRRAVVGSTVESAVPAAVHSLAVNGSAALHAPEPTTPAPSAPLMPTLPPGSRVFTKANVTYVLVPRPGTWPMAEKYAREFAKQFYPGMRSLLWSPRSRAEWDEVRIGLRFSDGLYWLGYHRYGPLNLRDIRVGWRSVAGTPVVFSLFNSSGPDAGCKKGFKLDEISSQDGGISGSFAYGKSCKAKENSAITWPPALYSLAEDVSENHSKAQGLIIEIRK